jgi:hypothetical protein
MTTITTSATKRLLALAAILALGSTLSVAQQPGGSPQDDGPDPALANMAPADAAAMAAQQNPGQPTQSGQSYQSQPGQSYPQQPAAPIVRSAPGQALSGADAYNAPPPDAEDQPIADPQATADVAAGEAAMDDANLSADQPPPPLPTYDQPPAPADNYEWTPGYWGYANADYYWVPGVWINPPYYGALWTPPYWGFYGGRYRWHPGYWGTHVGFYGGVNYGFGYIGVGYFGGYWNGNRFFYNRSVTHVGAGVNNVYNRTVVFNNHQYGAVSNNHISYNGGRGGLNAAPRPAEFVAMHEQHVNALPGQVRLHQASIQNHEAAFSANHGNPSTLAQARPIGATRPISANPNAFQQRQGSFQQRPAMQPRMQPQPQQQQSRPQPQFHSAPAAPQSRPAPAAAPHASGGGNGKH